jgi:predicted NBD/HSP70 family sugar kinase
MYVGIDIGGTKILAAASPTGHSMKRSQKIATPQSAKAAIDAMVDLVHQVAGDDPVASVGVSSQSTLAQCRD